MLPSGEGIGESLRETRASKGQSLLPLLYPEVQGMSTILLALLLGAAPDPVEKAEAPQTLLYVRTTPAGARVCLDGKALGNSNELFPVKPGAYKIVVDLEGYEPQEQQIKIRDGRITRIELTLKKLPTAGAPGSSEPRSTAKKVAGGDAGGNLLKNPGIESGETTPEAWQRGAAIPGVKYLWDRKTGREGKASLSIEKTVNRYFPIAQWSQTIDREGKRPALTISAQVKAQRMTKAIVDVIFYDASGEWISHQWVAYIGSKQNGDPPANHDWKQYGNKVAIPPQAKKICIGLQVYGPGKVWFDDVRAEYAD